MIHITTHLLKFTFRLAARLLIPGLCLVLMSAAVSAEPPRDRDKNKSIRIKSSYLYNFSKYITWPDEAFEKEESPIVIGILGGVSCLFNPL